MRKSRTTNWTRGWRREAPCHASKASARRDGAARHRPRVDRSREVFGEPSALRYERLIKRALRDITSAADPIGAKPLDTDPALRLHHLRNSRARMAGAAVGEPRHVLVYRRVGPDLVIVLRLLHDAMDMPARLVGPT